MKKPCGKRGPHGIPCGLPENHLGKHQNGTQCPTWSDDECQAEEHQAELWGEPAKK